MRGYGKIILGINPGIVLFIEINMKTAVRFSFFLFLSGFFLTSCNFLKKDSKESKVETKKTASGILSGELDVLVDETILFIITEHKELFEGSYPNAQINLIAENEKVAIHKLINREADFAILTRTLDEEESLSFEKRSIKPRVFPAAKEGIVFFTNHDGPDSKIQLEQVKSLLRGEEIEGFNTLLFESINSSLFRQLKNIFNIDKVSGAKVSETESLDSLVSKVVREPGVIAVVSYDEFRTIKKTFKDINKIRILDVQNSMGEQADGDYYAPTQSNFGLGKYPLMRDIYVLNYQPKTALGIGWSSFITGDRGQRVFLKAGMLPDTMPGREIIIRDKVE